MPIDTLPCGRMWKPRSRRPEAWSAQMKLVGRRSAGIATAADMQPMVPASLASTLITPGAKLWTLDRRLAERAGRFRVAA